MKKIGASGFTIVELLMVIIVSAVVIGSLSLIVSGHAHLSQRARNVVAADSFVESKIESLRSKGYLSLTIGTSSLTSEVPAELKQGSASMTITQNSIATKKIFITITYNDQGQQRTYSYSTLIGELGVGQY